MDLGGAVWLELCLGCVCVCERDRQTERNEQRKYGCIWIGFVCEWVSLDYV